MGKGRVCDARCHNARKPGCDCWCGGLFHGGQGQAAREAFCAVWGDEIPRQGEPVQQELFAGASPAGGERWARAMAAAQEGRRQR